MNPERFTLRELVWMAEAAQQERWAHTSCVMALIANVNRDPKKHRAFRPADFNPFGDSDRVRRGVPITTENIADLKALVKKSRQRKGE